jgi:dedicator of cytokinesis protein 3
LILLSRISKGFLPSQVYQGEEKEFHQLHEQIIRNNKCSPLPGQPNYGIVVSLRILHGELSQVREENPLLFKNICLTKKLGFSDVIMPGDIRNDLYLKLERGEFERGGKSTGKNIEVIFQRCISNINILFELRISAM